MAQPPPQVLDLIQRFDRNHEAYRSPHYNETQLRREFLYPLFKSIGWDTALATVRESRQTKQTPYSPASNPALTTPGMPTATAQLYPV